MALFLSYGIDFTKNENLLKEQLNATLKRMDSEQLNKFSSRMSAMVDTVNEVSKNEITSREHGIPHLAYTSPPVTSALGSSSTIRALPASPTTTGTLPVALPASPTTTGTLPVALADSPTTTGTLPVAPRTGTTSTREKTVEIGGKMLKIGDRVRIKDDAAPFIGDQRPGKCLGKPKYGDIGTIDNIDLSDPKGLVVSVVCNVKDPKERSGAWYEASYLEPVEEPTAPSVPASASTSLPAPPFTRFPKSLLRQSKDFEQGDTWGDFAERNPPEKLPLGPEPTPSIPVSTQPSSRGNTEARGAPRNRDSRRTSRERRRRGGKRTTYRRSK